MKIVQINKMKVNIFEEQELKEKLGMEQKDIELVSTYQRTFPELLQDDIEGFVINTRTLWEKLNEGAEYSTWFKRRSNKLKLVENVDYASIDTCVKREKGGTILKEKYVTLDVAKDIAMLSGTDIGNEVRKYFKVMEKTLRNYEKWIATREPEKDGANVMRSHIASWCDRNGYDKTLKKFYTREFNLLNESLVGLDAQGIKYEIGYKDKQTREHLLEMENKALSFLQDLNISLLNADMSFEDRSNIIKITCNTKYPKLKRVG